MGVIALDVFSIPRAALALRVGLAADPKKDVLRAEKTAHTHGDVVWVVPASIDPKHKSAARPTTTTRTRFRTLTMA